MSFCCTDFAKALEDGTDNEGYGPVIHSDYGQDRFFIGDIETPIKFCPWCGTKLHSKTEPNEQLAEIVRRVAALAEAGSSSPDGHMEEDDIREDVLRAIAAGAENTRELAAAALRTEEHDFPRWYE